MSRKSGFDARGLDAKGFDAWADAIRTGSRRDLARGITLVESNRIEDVEPAQELLERLIPFSGSADRIGISGMPGAGKSTFIEMLGRILAEDGHKVAVLAVDPSSPVSGGSILGDKTRMADLSRMDQVFVRPSPAGRTPGGVARKTREAMLLCEAAGYDTVLVETVGAGQSEWRVSSMTDLFIVLMLPNAGDVLQGIKRGILEMSDIILVNKADGTRREAAAEAAEQYRNALQITDVDGSGTTVRTCSALDRASVNECRRVASEMLSTRKEDSSFDEKRRTQLRQWIRSLAEDSLLQLLEDDRGFPGMLDELEREISEGKTTPLRAGLSLRNRIIREIGRWNSKSGLPL